MKLNLVFNPPPYPFKMIRLSRLLFLVFKFFLCALSTLSLAHSNQNVLTLFLPYLLIKSCTNLTPLSAGRSLPVVHT